MSDAILSELKSAVTNKLKFFVCPHFIYSPTYDIFLGPETLVTTRNYWAQAPIFAKMLLEIFNKRWQTLDVKSMMSEFLRSSSEILITQDTLSSVHRFKRKEDASLS